MRIVGLLDRYVVREVAGPAALGLVTYTFLLMMRPIFDLVEQIFVRGLAAKDGLLLLWTSIPHVIVMTIPMSYLFGVLLAMGRLNTDSEIIAMQASGVSNRRLLRPVLGLALAMAAVNGYLSMKVIPESSRVLRELKVRLFANVKALQHVEPRVFHESFPNLLLYIDDVEPKTGYWRDVLLFDRTQSGVERLTLARRGRVASAGSLQASAQGTEASVDSPWLLLEEVATHEFMTANPARYRVSVNQSRLFRLSTERQGETTYRPGIRELGTLDLLEAMRDNPSEGQEPDKVRMERRLAAIEMHKRLAIPAACVSFALLALPLGVGSRSGGRGRGFILSVGVILVYYIVFNHGELLAVEGRLPAWVGIWLANMLLAAVGLLSMRQMGRWLGERQREGWLVRASKRVSEWRHAHLSRRQTEHALTGSIPIHLQRRRYSPGFPTLLDRYLTRRLLSPLLLVLASTASLYVVVDLTDHIDEIGKNHPPLDVVFSYYWNLLPQVLLDVTPFGVMIAVLILLTMLERQVELTAFKAAGLSLFRLMVPVLVMAAMATGGLWFLQESAVPTANREAKRLLDRIKGHEGLRSYQATDRQWLLSRDGSALYNFLRYDGPSQTMIRFTLFRMDDANKLRFHLSADRVMFRSGSWITDSGWFRQILPDGTDEFHRIAGPMEVGIPETPDYFGQEFRQPTQMSLKELGRYIRELLDSGYNPMRLMVRWHQKLSYPLSAFVMVFLALPFGLNRGGRRVTTMHGVALALGLGIGYFVLIAVFGKMSEASLLPPAVGAWAPVVLATLFALNRMTTLRT